MINNVYSYDYSVENAYIITMKGNKISESLSDRCASSCDSVGQKYTIFPAFDGSNGNIIVPPQYENSPWLKWIKIYTDILSPTQIACYYSHFSLWAKCLELDRPIVILEHDAIMVNKYDFHLSYNSIVYLGSSEQYLEGSPVYSIPPHGTSDNSKNRFICRYPTIMC